MPAESRVPLVGCALASAHVTLLAVAYVLGEYHAGKLGAVPGGLNTLVGLALFLGFWLLVWAPTALALRDVRRISALRLQDAVARGTRFGGRAGVAAFMLLEVQLLGILLGASIETIAASDHSWTMAGALEVLARRAAGAQRRA